MLAWWMTGPGEPADVLELREAATPEPAAGQLLIEVEAAGISFPDLLQIRGAYQTPLPHPTVPGNEFVGRVLSGGAETRTRPGTRVAGYAVPGTGSFAPYTLTVEREALSVPDSLAPGMVLALPTNYVAAFLALHERANVRRGETVVITGAAGGVGTAALQLARLAGTRVIAVDLGKDRAATCLELGAHAVINSQEGDLLEQLQAQTAGQGADVVVDLVGGDVFEACRRCLAFDARIVIVGFSGGHIPQLKMNQLILRNFSITGLNAAGYSAYRPDRYRQVTRKVIDLCARGDITPHVHPPFAYTDAVVALDALAAGQVTGKAFISLDRA